MSKNQVIYEILGQFLTYLQNWFLLSNLEFECLHAQIGCRRIFIKFFSRIKDDSDCKIANFTSTSIFLLWLGEITHMLPFRREADRVSDESSDIKYLVRMGLTHSKVWIRHRARAIKDIKSNPKRSWKKDLECRFCGYKILETQEHLEECRGLSWERRNLKMDTEGGKINIFNSFEKKLGWSGPSPATVAKTWFMNILPLLLNLGYHNCTLFVLANF